MTTVNDVYEGIAAWTNLIINPVTIIDVWINSATLKITGAVASGTDYGLTIDGTAYDHTASGSDTPKTVLQAIKTLVDVDFAGILHTEVFPTEEDTTLEIYTLTLPFQIEVLTNLERMPIFVVQEHQNNPAPTKTNTYIAIGYRPTGGRKGQEEKQEMASVTPSDPGYLELRTQFEGLIELREINGNGGLLEQLVTTFARQDVMDLLDTYGVVTRNIVNGPYPIPYTEQEKWVRASILEITIGFVGSDVYMPGVIENVELEGTITGSVKPHTITLP